MQPPIMPSREAIKTSAMARKRKNKNTVMSQVVLMAMTNVSHTVKKRTGIVDPTILATQLAVDVPRTISSTSNRDIATTNAAPLLDWYTSALSTLECDHQCLVAL